MNVVTEFSATLVGNRLSIDKIEMVSLHHIWGVRFNGRPVAIGASVSVIPA